MQTKLPSRCRVYLVAMLTLVGTFAMLGCSSDDGDELRSVPGVAVDLNSPALAAAALGNTTFAFSTGVPRFETGAQTDVAFTENALGAIITAGASSATTALAYSSCRFAVGSSNFPPGSPLAPEQSVLIEQCEFEVTAEDVPVGGGPVDGAGFLRLGPGTTSAVVRVQVEIDGEDGTLIINGFDTGIFITGAGGDTDDD